jgi:3-dehydrosphinganine reductase
MKSFDGKNALITGGSSGIGLSMARLLANEGANLWLLGRDAQKLENACAEVMADRRSSSQQVFTIQADVAQKESVDQGLAAMLEQIGAPDLLVNSAGITHPGEFEQMDIHFHRDNMEINYFGSLYTTMAVVPGMIKRKTGHIVNISSLVGMHGLYGYSAYAPSKFALRGLSDVLRYELKPYGIDISIVFPSDTITPQLEYENKHKPAILKALSESNTKPVSAKHVAEKTLQAVKRGKYMIFPSSDGALWFFVYTLLPGNLMYRMVDMLMVDARKKAGKYLAGK